MSLLPPEKPPRAASRLLPFYIGSFCILWSLGFVMGKVGVTDCPPLILLTARFLLAGVVIFAISIVRGEAWSLSWREIGTFTIIGLANNAIYLSFSYTALQSVSAGLVGLISSTNPILTALLAALFLGEKLTWRKAAGLCLGVAGVALIVAHRVSIGSDDWLGIKLTFAALASFATGTILFKILAPKGNLWIGNGIQNLAAGIALAPIAFTLSSIDDIVPSAQLVGALTYLVLGGSILAFQLWFHLLKVCGATAASSFHFLMPPLSILFAWAVLGEHVVALDLLGIIPVALGIYLVTRPSPVKLSASILAN